MVENENCFLVAETESHCAAINRNCLPIFTVTCLIFLALNKRKRKKPVTCEVTCERAPCEVTFRYCYFFILIQDFR